MKKVIPFSFLVFAVGFLLGLIFSPVLSSQQEGRYREWGTESYACAAKGYGWWYAGNGICCQGPVGGPSDICTRIN